MFEMMLWEYIIICKNLLLLLQCLNFDMRIFLLSFGIKISLIIREYKMCLMYLKRLIKMQKKNKKKEKLWYIFLKKNNMIINGLYIFLLKLIFLNF